MENLRNCPFCGEASVSFREGSTFRWVFVECDCGAKIEVRKADRSLPADDPINRIKAIEAWNKRQESELRFDIKVVSEANMREHWAAKHCRKKRQQRDFTLLWRSYRPTVQLPAVITFTRYSSRLLDTDNLAGAFKHVQDAIARELGIDDGDGSVEWRYEQERIAKRECYFTVEIDRGTNIETDEFDGVKEAEEV